MNIRITVKELQVMVNDLVERDIETVEILITGKFPLSANGPMYPKNINFYADMPDDKHGQIDMGDILEVGNDRDDL